MNRITISGRLVRDPELRVTKSGTEVCDICVAVDRRAKSGGEKVADFIDCTAWGKTGVFVSTYFRKGDGIELDGRMESRKWVDKDGSNRTSWSVNVDNVEFPKGKRSPSEELAQDEPVQPGEFSPVNPVPDEPLPF